MAADPYRQPADLPEPPRGPRWGVTRLTKLWSLIRRRVFPEDYRLRLLENRRHARFRRIRRHLDTMDTERERQERKLIEIEQELERLGVKL